MILTAHQPVYLPWLGLFHKIAEADLFCYFDIVQYQKKDFNNRNKIKTSSGSHWLSVPVKSKNHLNTLISEAQIVEDGWRKKHLKSIYLSYKKSPYFEEYYSELEKIILNENHDLLTDLNYDLLVFFLNALSINVPIVKASSYSFQGLKSDLVMKTSPLISISSGNSFLSFDGILSIFVILFVTFSPIVPLPLVPAQNKLPFLYVKFNDKPSIFGSHIYTSSFSTL